MDTDEHLHLKIGIKCLSTVGFWPIHFKSKALTFLYSLYFSVTITFYVIFVMTEAIEMYFVIRKKSLDEFSILMEISFLHTFGLGKVLVVGSDAFKRLAKKVRVTERNILTGTDERVRKIYMDHVNKNHTVNRIMINLALITCVVYVLTPLTLELIYPTQILYDIIDDRLVYRPRPLPLASWFPFNRYEYYKTSFVIQTAAITVLPTYIVACNNFFFGLTIFGMGQIKILQQCIMDIGKIVRGKHGRDSTVTEDIRKCVAYQKSIMVFVQELSDAMRIFLLLDFAACAMEIAMIGFQAAVMDMSLPLVKQLTYLASILVQLFFYYWYANEILVESIELSSAAWNSDWYNFSESNRKTLLIFMMRAQKPMTLSVGPFYYMSTQTMMSIIRAGYSYAAVMRRLYSK